MTENVFINFTWLWIAVAIAVFVLLHFVKAPYGRHTSKNWGPMVSNKWGWFFMELPALLLMPLLAIFGEREKDVLSWILICLWSLHYINRTLIFPFRIKTEGKKMPLFIVLSAVFFNGVNGFLNGYWLGFLAPGDKSFLSWNVLLGLMLFFAGMYINQKTDTKLIALRAKNEGYQIPKGWLFKYISCPNHFGEILEWTGFALAAWSLPGATFAIWTFCNLAPRAFAHHKWYKAHFKDYPKDRKALIPFVK